MTEGAVTDESHSGKGTHARKQGRSQSLAGLIVLPTETKHLKGEIEKFKFKRQSNRMNPRIQK
jgi:hypothetical protein